MTTRTTKNWTNRTAAFGLGLALLGGMTLVAAPAHAEEVPAVAEVTPEVTPEATPDATATPAAPEAPATTDTAVPAEDPAAPEVAPEPSDDSTYVPAPSETPTTDPATPAAPVLPDIEGGTVTISGDSVVGNTLKGSTTGWPAGTTLTYQWGEGFGRYGGEVEGATALDYTLTSAEAGGTMVLLVYGSLDGFATTMQRAFAETTVSSPLKPAALATDSAALSTSLAAANVTVEPQASAGLPAGALNPKNAYSATFEWMHIRDSYVDAYVYSQPTLVGSFAVIDGVVQIPLSAALLSSLPAGTHTLVITGQTSGLTQAVSLQVAPSAVTAVRAGNTVRAGSTLAETGASAAWPLTAAAVFLLLGAVLLLSRRRLSA